MMHYSIYAGLALLLCIACRSNITHHTKSYKYDENSVPEGKIDSVDLSSNFTLYVRKIYRDSTQAVFKRASSFDKLVNPREKTVQQYSLTESFTPSMDSRLIELEYIFYSLQKKQFIYITTVPDLRHDYYSKTRQNDTLNMDTLNVYDFHAFRVGRIDPKKTNLIHFKDFKRPYTHDWEIGFKDDSLFILRMQEFYDSIYFDERSVVNSVKSGVKFSRAKDYRLIFHCPNARPLKTEMPKIYFVKPDSSINKYCIYFKFPLPNKTVANKGKRSTPKHPYVTLLFKNAKHVPVDPSAILSRP